MSILAFFGPVLVFLVFFLPLDVKGRLEGIFDGLQVGFFKGILLGDPDGIVDGKFDGDNDGAPGGAWQLYPPVTAVSAMPASE